jgi:hypothetical protein
MPISVPNMTASGMPTMMMRKVFLTPCVNASRIAAFEFSGLSAMEMPLG